MKHILVQSQAKALPRRSFVKLCASTAAAVSASPQLLAQAAQAPLQLYERVRLMDRNGAPLRASAIPRHESLIFNYPFVTTPCFLLNLGKAISGNINLRTEQGTAYLWPGGVGPSHSLVCFSAICAHKMSHPAKTVSFINYRPETVSFRDHDQQLIKRDGVIMCCSEKSVYDPAKGASVLGGPAKQPLCSILIEYKASDDSLYALGCYGGEMFDKFYAVFEPRLQMEWGRSDVRTVVAKNTVVMPISEYSKRQMMCGA